MSQAPGLSGTPVCGQRSSAASSASWARSSASPTSRTIRASPAISLADSIRQTASITRWVSVAVTPWNQGDGAEWCKLVFHMKTSSERVENRHRSLDVPRRVSGAVLSLRLRTQPVLGLAQLGGQRLPEVLGREHLPDLDVRLAAPVRVRR